MMKQNKGLASSIVISIFLTIFAFIILFLLTNSFSQMMEDFKTSAQESSNGDPGAGIASIFAALVVGFAFIIAFLIPMIFMFVASLILLPISIKNRKVETKWIRILSYVFDGALAFCIVFDILKFILIRVGIG